ncbi:hypothetical protein C3D14_17660 [Salmonella enterica]|nr:hypothetical protein [Salmonella enterica]EDD5452153.1 hypothetical protein [Salmonella enterica subsp. enterica serovar Paratyphi B]EDE4810710.1 hypothetical protein [Salmonella enterica subsp. enterica serovar Paratyphi B]
MFNIRLYQISKPTPISNRYQYNRYQNYGKYKKYESSIFYNIFDIIGF